MYAYNATFFQPGLAILHQLQKNIIIIIFMMVLPQEPVVFPGISNGYYASNIFKATAGKGKDEELGEIVTAVPQDNTDFQIQIYTDLTNPSDPTSGTPAYATPMEYTQAFAGIQTIRLEKPVKIPPGTLYSVVLQIPNGSQRYYLEKTSSSSSWFTTVAGIEQIKVFIPQMEKDGQMQPNPSIVSPLRHIPEP